MLGNCTYERDYSREIGDKEGGGGKKRKESGRWGRAEVKCKEHQVSAAISFAGSAAPTLSESVSRRTADVRR